MHWDKLQQVIEFISCQGIDIEFLGRVSDLSGHEDLGLPFNVNGCAWIKDRLIGIYSDNPLDDAEGIICCLVHEFGHIKGCTADEETAWEVGMNHIPKELIPECVNVFKEVCLRDYKENYA